MSVEFLEEQLREAEKPIKEMSRAELIDFLCVKYRLGSDFLSDHWSSKAAIAKLSKVIETDGLSEDAKKCLGDNQQVIWPFELAKALAESICNDIDFQEDLANDLRRSLFMPLFEAEYEAKEEAELRHVIEDYAYGLTSLNGAERSRKMSISKLYDDRMKKLRMINYKKIFSPALQPYEQVFQVNIAAARYVWEQIAQHVLPSYEELVMQFSSPDGLGDLPTKWLTIAKACEDKGFSTVDER
ncbi:MAG: hypothetical protein ACK5XN_32435, partial [Bacteroidota bacterium]